MYVQYFHAHLIHWDALRQGQSPSVNLAGKKLKALNENTIFCAQDHTAKTQKSYQQTKTLAFIPKRQKGTNHWQSSLQYYSCLSVLLGILATQAAQDPNRIGFHF